jgi:KTSC domain-containing protein
MKLEQGVGGMKRQKPVHGSDLIASMGWRAGEMEIRYSDGAVFVYFKFPFSTYAALKRSKHPGQDFLKIRGQYNFKRIN